MQSDMIIAVYFYVCVFEKVGNSGDFANGRLFIKKSLPRFSSIFSETIKLIFFFIFKKDFSFLFLKFDKMKNIILSVF